ncbi:MAG: HAMP domain-containing histidine kinase [Lysobacteraceae bacterium]|nr:MAG: HAMP domain-containing histidine kinase [Xanthomonadaceae bacterium]
MTRESPGRLFSRLVHDLRGPLMPLRTAAWLLRNEPDQSARVRELADIVDRQSTRLAHMLDELGDWGRSSDAMPLALKAVEVPLALDMAIGGIQECAIEPRYGASMQEVRVDGDQDQLVRMLRTVIGHAVQRSGERAPDVDVDLDGGQLRIRVQDHGPALSEAEREALLTLPQDSPFDAGLGLRLLLARRIAEAHGGSLLVDGDAQQDGLALVCLLPARG